MEEELTRKEIAMHYGVTQNTIFEWVRRGCPNKMKARKPQVFARMFKVSEVDSWLSEKRIKK